jgi:hypothetical protein
MHMLARIDAPAAAKQVELRGGFSGKSNQILYAALEHLLIEAADGVKLEMLRGSMVGQGLGVAVLLVENDSVRILFEMVRNVGDAAGLQARGSGQEAERLDNLGTIFRVEFQAYGKTYHREIVSRGS